MKVPALASAPRPKASDWLYSYFLGPQTRTLKLCEAGCGICLSVARLDAIQVG